MRHIFLVVALLFAGIVSALSAPSIELNKAGAGRIAVQVQTPTPVTGFNLYLDKQYYLTIRPARGATRFEFDGRDGTYCVVSFETTASDTQYSVCSNSVVYREDVTTPNPTPVPANGAPTPPPNLRSIRYSTTAGKLFWEAASDDGRAKAYKVIRDGQLLVTRDARTYFDALLQRDRAYKYQVIAVDDKGLESAAALVTLNTSGSGTGTPPTTPPITPNPPASGFSVKLAQNDVTLQEGNNYGAGSLGRHGFLCQ